MRDILHDIIEDKKVEVAALKSSTTLEELKARVAAMPRDIISMKVSLQGSTSGIISEFKRRSPSKGWIKREGDVLDVTSQYQSVGAAAISILTDNKYFGGELSDLTSARGGLQIPILRKDFIIDKVQIYEAYLAGADAILLIAAALTPEQCESLALTARELGLETLLEIHSEQEIAYISSGIDMVGVNNRNLGTFVTSLDNSVRLAPLLPKDKLLVSESGIASMEDILMLREYGYRGFLIGEAFMRTDNPGSSLRAFIEGVQ